VGSFLGKGIDLAPSKRASMAGATDPYPVLTVLFVCCTRKINCVIVSAKSNLLSLHAANANVAAVLILPASCLRQASAYRRVCN
jgi:hypothetical protein